MKSNKYLEPFLTLKGESNDEYSLYKGSVDDLTMRELGYEMSGAVDLIDLQPKDAEQGQDAKFFDLVELLIIFAKTEKRGDLIERLKTIFVEEGSEFSIHGFMIVNTANEGLRSIAPLIKEKILKEKIQEFYDQQRMSLKPNYEFLAKTSAEIVQLIFSSPTSKEKTQKYASDLCLKVAQEWTEKNKATDLSTLLSETVKNAKALSNQIADVRHTDRTTIPVDSPDIYKIVASKNINIAELFILSLPEMYISKQDPEGLKSSYLSRYGIDKTSGWFVKTKEQQSPDDIDPDNIPFWLIMQVASKA